MAFNTIQFSRALAELELPVPETHVLNDLYDLEGENLIRSVDAVKAKNDRAVFYLKGILFAVVPATKERLQRNKLLCPPLNVLVMIGKRAGPDFAIRLKAWDDAGGIECEDARYIRMTVANALAASTTQAAQGKKSAAAPGAGIASDAAPAVTPAPLPRAEPRSAADHHDRHESKNSSRSATPENDDVKTPPGDRQRNEGESNEREYISHHIYGGSAAVCFSADTTRGGVHTVRIEAAAKAGGSFDWGKKVAIQLSKRELPLVLATLLLWLPKFEGKGHGENNEKWFTLEKQAGKHYLSVRSKDKPSLNVPILPGDGYALTTLLIRQMLANDPFLSSDVILAIVRKQAELAGTVEGGAHAAQHG
jgi:hypothetical protein